MLNFSIGMQVKKELEDFRSSKIRLASFKQDEVSVRYLTKNKTGYYFNQAETLEIIDLYYNSQFENGPLDKLNQRKIFMNVGKFRSQVASKQTNLDSKNFRFIPDDYADPYTALFMQKDFKEWSKDTYFGELVNDCVENWPKYGTLVLKKVGNKIEFVPLQVLRNEQTAKSLETATYVIEEHADMQLWEMQEMKNWNCEGLTLKFGETTSVYERYGRVPLKWLKEHDNQKREVLDGDENKYVDALVIMCWPQGMSPKNGKEGVHTFFAGQITSRPYREVHWDKQHGRWLGIGVMEDLIENQQAKNIIVNLVRRSLHWSSKRVMQSANADVAAKNLAADVPDGAIIEVGPNGQITEVNLSAKTNTDFTTFLQEWERNSDQKAFTYEVATGESMPSGTPFRLGVVLSNAVATYFGFKKEKLGLFLKKSILDFLVPQFIKDMSDEERILIMFSGESGFEVLKDAALQYVKSKQSIKTLLGGKSVDGLSMDEAVASYKNASSIPFVMPKGKYKTAKVKFDLTVTGEEIALEEKLETLKNLYQLMAAKQDPRAEKVLERIAALSGESMSQFGTPSAPAQTPAAINVNPNAIKQPVAAPA